MRGIFHMSSTNKEYNSIIYGYYSLLVVYNYIYVLYVFKSSMYILINYIIYNLENIFSYLLIINIF